MAAERYLLIINFLIGVYFRISKEESDIPSEGFKKIGIFQI